MKTKEERRLERLAESERPVITLEEFIETERAKLPKTLTPVTLETFTKWKQQRMEKKRAEEELELKKQKLKVLSGKQLMDSGKFVAEEEEDEDEQHGAWDINDLRRRMSEIDEEPPELEENGVSSLGGQSSRSSVEETIES